MAVTGPLGTENVQWCGTLNMTITNEGARGKFEVGKAYFLDFTLAPGA